MKLLNTWTRCAEKFKLSTLSLAPWRIVEGQHQISTRKLVDTLEEQALLEEMIDRVKPPLPKDLVSLHYLLSTPFRHPPLKHGSRFGTRAEKSIFYSSIEPETSFSELAYYRLVFLNGMIANPGLVELDHTLFQVKATPRSFADLTIHPMNQFRSEISSPTSYSKSQALGNLMREAQIDAFAYFSARASKEGVNIGIFNPKIFSHPKPTTSQSWRSFATQKQVELIRLDGGVIGSKTATFLKSNFETSGRLPTPAI